MILKEQNNQKKTLMDGMLDGNHEQESAPSTNGKASPWLFFPVGSLVLFCHVGLLGNSGKVCVY